MRTKLITSSNLIVMGAETACRSHLQFIIDTFSRSKHGLTMRCIDHKDKQNFESVSTLVSENVEQCLKEIDNEMCTKGTTFYLQLMRDVRDSFLNKEISPLSRILLMWRTMFFSRIWRKWLEENDYCEGEQLITPNAYTCIEVMDIYWWL